MFWSEGEDEDDDEEEEEEDVQESRTLAERLTPTTQAAGAASVAMTAAEPAGAEWHACECGGAARFSFSRPAPVECPLLATDRLATEWLAVPAPATAVAAAAAAASLFWVPQILAFPFGVWPSEWWGTPAEAVTASAILSSFGSACGESCCCCGVAIGVRIEGPASSPCSPSFPSFFASSSSSSSSAPSSHPSFSPSTSVSPCSSSPEDTLTSLRAEFVSLSLSSPSSSACRAECAW